MSVTIKEKLILRRSGEYTDAKQESEILPIPYGDSRGIGSGGVWSCPCTKVDDATPLYEYLVADCLISTSNLTLYDGDDIASGYSLAEVSGTIVATFTTKPDNDMSARGTGKIKDGSLLENPIDIMLDILEMAGYTTIDPKSVATAYQATDLLKAAGVLLQDVSLQTVLQDLLGSFLGNFWVDADGVLQLAFESLLTRHNIQGYFVERDCEQFRVTESLDNICNQATILYAPTFTQTDRRFSEGAKLNFLGYINGADTKDALSQRRYDVQAQTFELPWIYEQSTAQLIQGQILTKFKDATKIIDLTEKNYHNLFVQNNQQVCFSCRSIFDDEGYPLMNQIGRVVRKKPLFQERGIEWQVIDTGMYVSYPPPALDGEALLDGSLTLGGQRMRERFV